MHLLSLNLFHPSPFPALLDWTAVWPTCVIWIRAGYRDLDENCNILDFNWIPPTSQSQEAGGQTADNLLKVTEFLKRTFYVW